MKKIVLALLGLSLGGFVWGQRQCKSFDYERQLVQADPSIEIAHRSAENFVALHESTSRIGSGGASKIITIPVIVHVLFHYPGENISDDVVASQVAALNRDFRKLNADTTKIPAAFKPYAADCGIEFKLATVDARGRATTGVIHKYTPVTAWTTDDKIKLSSEMGDDGWDPKSYLNFWVGTLDKFLGYSSVPGDPANKDGVVFSNTIFGVTGSGAFGQGRTAVHEVGHWLGLRHLWGDTDCGDDGVADTPRQQTFTNGCPSGPRVTSCSTSPDGDMYMDYMDFTNDDCLLMFTSGQRQKMRALFDAGGARYSILSSNAFSAPTSEESPLPDSSPQWLHVKTYPNPASTELTINLEFDARWVGKQLQVINISGQTEMKRTITSKIQKLDISKLKPGLYFIRAEKDGDRILEKFIKS